MSYEFPWKSMYPPEIPLQQDYPPLPLYGFLEEAAREYPGKTAISFSGKKLSYQELLQASNRFARGLQDLGIGKGDRVSVMLPNVPQAVIAYYGILFTGATVVETNPLYTERELQFQLNDSGSIALICLDLLYPRVKKIKSRTPLQWVIATGINDYLPFPKDVLYSLSLRLQRKFMAKKDRNDPGTVSFLSLCKDEGELQVRADIDPDKDLALLQYTGGTTGRSKGVMLTHGNMVANVLQCKTWFSEAKRGEEIFLSALPFFHVYGLTVCMNFAVSLAACMVLVPRFQAKKLIKIIDKERPTLFPGAPTMYIALLNLPEIERYNLTSIKFCISGSAPMPVDVLQKFEAISGCRIVEGYGLTECSPITHVNPIKGIRKSGSIGLPLTDTKAKIIHMENGEEVPPGEIGELCIKGPQVMKGYWRMEEETRAVLQDGWLLTGDIGKMDLEGYFYIVDRKKDLIIAGGFNIYPREVEEVLYEHPAIREAAVVGVPDPYRGETVKAFIVPKENMKVSPEELNQFCRERLASYKVPRLYEFRKELPKTIVGKILRRVLLEEEQNDGA